jgi:signal peptidase I
LIGDFLFVSKVNYGARVPMTAVALPMVHDSIPVVKNKIIPELAANTLLKITGIEDIKRTDIVVLGLCTVHYFFEAKGSPV